MESQPERDGPVISQSAEPTLVSVSLRSRETEKKTKKQHNSSDLVVVFLSQISRQTT